MATAMLPCARQQVLTCDLKHWAATQHDRRVQWLLGDAERHTLSHMIIEEVLS